MMYIDRSDALHNGFDLSGLKYLINRVENNPVIDKKPAKDNQFNIKSIYKFNTTKQLAISNFLYAEISSRENLALVD